MTDKYRLDDSGLYVPYFYTKKPKRPIAFDFFAGAGGMGCGFIQAGIEIVGANEFDPFASITYMVNLGCYPMAIHFIDGEKDKEKLNAAVNKCYGLKECKQELKEEDFKKICDEIIRQRNVSKQNGMKEKDLNEYYGTENIIKSRDCAGSGWISSTNYPGVKNFWFGDIRKLKGKDILDTLGLKQGDLDVVAGGPPCQGFSRSGKQQINDPRNGLIYEYARMINELQPKTFVMEEVPDILNFYDPDGVLVLDKFCLLLQEGGYGKWENIKKSLVMQPNASAVIKDNLRMKGNSKLPKNKKCSEEKNETLSLF